MSLMTHQHPSTPVRVMIHILEYIVIVDCSIDTASAMCMSGRKGLYRFLHIVSGPFLLTFNRPTAWRLVGRPKSSRAHFHPRLGYLPGQPRDLP